MLLPRLVQSFLSSSHLTLSAYGRTPPRAHFSAGWSLINRLFALCVWPRPGSLAEIGSHHLLAKTIPSTRTSRNPAPFLYRPRDTHNCRKSLRADTLSKYIHLRRDGGIGVRIAMWVHLSRRGRQPVTCCRAGYHLHASTIAAEQALASIRCLICRWASGVEGATGSCRDFPHHFPLYLHDEALTHARSLMRTGSDH